MNSGNCRGLSDIPIPISSGKEAGIFYFLQSSLCLIYILGFPSGLVVKNSPASAGDTGLIPGSARRPGEGNGYPLQYSILGSSRTRGGWWATVRGVAKSRTLFSNVNNNPLYFSGSSRLSIPALPLTHLTSRSPAPSTLLPASQGRPETRYTVFCKGLACNRQSVNIHFPFFFIFTPSTETDENTSECLHFI